MLILSEPSRQILANQDEVGATQDEISTDQDQIWENPNYEIFVEKMADLSDPKLRLNINLHHMLML